VGRRAALAPEHLPYHRPLLDFLREQHALGRPLYLCHGGEAALAGRVREHLGLFAGVVEGDGPSPGQAPGALYAAGDAARGHPAWRDVVGAVAVNPSPASLAELRGLGKPLLVLEDREPAPRVIVRALRLHQWAKNLLLLVPLIASHQVLEPRLWTLGLWALLAFGLCASATYLFNDLLDLPSDRADADKRRRPLAAGQLGLGRGVLLMALTFLAGLACAWPFAWDFWAVLGAYLALTVAYSLFLKRVEMLDVVVLATLYTLRIVAGNVAFAIEFSEWLLALSVFLFLSMAMMKRYTELSALRAAGRESPLRRGYVTGDLELVGTLGATSGYISVLVFSLYITSSRVRVLYAHPDLLWPVCLVMLYWVGRTWLIARRGEMHADPVVFALTDKISYIVGVLILVIIAMASGALF
jgi:4-hydroxybenzoate polyprenyltransferase